MNLTHLAAGHPVAGAHLPEIRTDSAAAGDRDRATGMKHAARRRIDRARHLAFHRSESAAGLDARIGTGTASRRARVIGITALSNNSSESASSTMRPLSALGHKRTLERLHRMSALPPKADIEVCAGVGRGRLWSGRTWFALAGCPLPAKNRHLSAICGYLPPGPP